MKYLLILFLFFSYHFLSAQQVISGKIIDAGDDKPLIGVNITVSGSEEIATISGLDGSFELEVPQNATTLLFKYIGYKDKEVPVEECKNSTIGLSVSATLLDEVIVVGYGTQVRSDMTGNVSKIAQEEIEGVPVNTLESVMQGRAAGVFVTNESGKVGFNTDVRIRGTSSINASVQPLYVIDGIVINSQDQLVLNNARLNPLADINFNDIESINILKDASAASIYGARASNGVVIITTKKGSSKTARVELDMNYGWSSPTIKRKWLNGSQYLELWDEAFANVADEEGRFRGLTAEESKDRWLEGWRDGNDTNWEDLMYKPDAGQKHIQLSISGGNEKTSFYASGGFTDQTPIIILNDFKRFSGRLNIAHQITDRFDFGMNMSLSRTILEEPPVDWDFASPGSLISQSPVQPLYDPDNPDEIFTNTVFFHAWNYVDNVEWETTNNRSLGNAYINWKPLENLTLHTDFGMDDFHSDAERYYNSRVARNTGRFNGWKRTWLNDGLHYSTNTYANYSLLSNTHKLDATLGMSYEDHHEEIVGVSGENFPNDDFQNISSASEITVGLESETDFSILSYFARFNYKNNNRYLFSISSRIDGDSRFGKDNRYGIFPAFSAGWILSEESIIKNNSSISYLKLRSSWGIMGNSPITHFPALGLFEGSRYGTQSGIIQTQIPNPDLKWEKTTQFDIGLDFGLFNDRISGQVDYYLKNTNDLLLNTNVPATTGFATQLRNFGKMKNEGFEFMISSYNLTGAFKWKTDINFSKNKNTVTDIGGQIINADNENVSISVIKEGHAIGVFFAPEYAGVDPLNGNALYYLNTEEENGQINRETTDTLAKARPVVIGDPNPDFIIGIGNTISWKGLELHVLFQGVYGNEGYNSGSKFQLSGFSWFDNQDIRILNRWQQSGDITDIPQLRFGNDTDDSSRFIEDASYLRLKNIRLSYQLPKHWIKKLGLQQMSIYFAGYNLMTFTNYQSGDPEVNTDIKDYIATNPSAITGNNFFTPPQAKTILVGLKAGF
ncbi:MAG: TonB-dependent receptor [Saprospiraceae bacterium]|nr:TonB-dependent receptor [Saprospiraceae bacterium]